MKNIATMTEDEQQQYFLECRQAIDKIDQQLLQLINQRAEYAEKIGTIKQLRGDHEMYRPEREAQILRHHIRNNPGPIPSAQVAHLFRELMSVCLSLEKPLKVAYLGPQGTFTEQAVFKHFGNSICAESKRTIDEVFRDVESGNVDFGIVPIENSTEGMVNHTLDMLVDANLYICGETHLRIHQNLISAASALNQIHRIYAHSQSFAQCRNWLDNNLPHAQKISVNSNAEAVKRARDDEFAAAIGGVQAAKHYHLPVLAANIEDDPNNTTRFLVIGTKIIPPSGHDKTSILVSAHDHAGLLLQLIEPLARHQVTMNRLESRPSRKGLWRYIFFIDILGHQDDPNVAQALQEIQVQATLFKVLGTYPVAVY